MTLSYGLHLSGTIYETHAVPLGLHSLEDTWLGPLTTDSDLTQLQRWIARPLRGKTPPTMGLAHCHHHAQLMLREWSECSFPPGGWRSTSSVQCFSVWKICAPMCCKDASKLSGGAELIEHVCLCASVCVYMCASVCVCVCGLRKGVVRLAHTQSE